jgi:4-hydroxybenzoate polyprenyltransferase
VLIRLHFGLSWLTITHPASMPDTYAWPVAGTAAARRTSIVRGLALACHPAPALAVTLVAVLLAVAVGLSGARVLLLGLAVGAGQLSIGWSNDRIDAARDLVAGRRDKPAALGAVPLGVLGTASGIALAAAVVLSLALGVRPGVAALLLVTAGWAYNLGLKSTVWSGAAYLVGFGALPAVPYLALPGSPWPPWWAVATGALLGFGAHFANVLPDLRDDAATGVRGLPQRMGRLGSVLTLACSLTAGSLVLAWGPSGNALALSITVTCVGIAGAGAAAVLAVRRPDSDAAFRVTLVLALLDVVLLLVLAG